MLPCAVNLAGAGLFLHLSRSRFAYVAPQWLVRMLAAFGFFYGTLACITAVATTGWWSSRSTAMTGQNLFVAAVFAGTSVAIMLGALRSKKDVFPIALIAGSWIAISSALLIDRMRLNDLGGLFVVAMWLIVTSTIAGWILMKCVRAWNVDERAHEMPA